MVTDTLSNEFLRISVNPLGAELAGLTDPVGTEYLWQGDPLVWSGRSPVLFPIVGKLAGDSYSYAGKAYTLPQHGFARLKNFRPAVRSSVLLSYSLGSDEDTRARYPFDFELTLSYRLDANTLHVEYRVTNRGGEPMPFSIGGHPAFSCAWHAGDALEDYFLEFEEAEIADACLVEGGLIDVNETRRILTNDDILPLTKTLFDSNALVFRGLKSSSITLRSRRHPNAVRVEFPGFPCLGIWSKPAAPFVCVEPWFGHADPAGRDPGSPLETKPGMILLAPNRSFTCEWRTSITR